MKKIISFILIAILCLGVLTSCDIIDSIKDKIGFGDQVDDAAADKAFNDAVMSLHRMYKDKAESTSVDFDLVSQVIVNGVKYPVTWTVDNEKVSIRESVNAGFYTVDLPDVNEEEFTYTITATITDGGERSEQKSYTFKMLVLDNSSVDTELKEGVAYKMFLIQGTFGQRMYALNTMQMGTGDGANYGKYIKTSTNPADGADYYAEIVDGGYKWYTEIDGVKYYLHAQTLFESEDKKAENKFSKYIGLSTENASVFSYNAEMGGVWTVLIEGNTFGVGTYSDYKTICISEGSFFSADVIGVSQFVIQFMTSEYASTLTPDEEIKVDEPAANSTLTIKEALELGVAVPSYTENKYYVTGEITNIYNAQYGNMYIKDAEGNELCIYGTYDATGANRFDAMTKQPVVGDTITVYGVIGNYNGTAQMKNGWITSINGEGETPVVPTLGVVDPVVGTAYKFGMVQGNLNATYYLAGGMDGYYMATTTDASAAIDVYLEETEGGYYLYTLDAAGAKLYINMVVSGTHVNGAYEATASTVYTYNTESKTLVASVQPEGANAPADYWFGTRNDKTYTTVGPCAVSYAGFYCQFYGATEGGNEGGEGGEGTETPEACQHADGNGDFKCDSCSAVVAPAADSVLTIEQALALGALFTKDTYTADKYYVTGTITEVYNTKYGNMYITDGTNTLCVYGSYDATGANRYDAAATKWVAGDNVTVYGIIGAYNDPQMKNGWVTVNTHNHAYSDATCAAPATCPCGATEGEALAHTWADATCTAPKTCSVCGAKDGEANGHNYVEGTCSVCGAAQPVAGEETTVTVSIADYAAANGWADSTLYANLTLDSNITVASSGTPVGNYGLNTGKYYSSSNTWRIYQNEVPSVTITAAEGKTIVSVKITYSVKNSGTLTLDGAAIASGTVVEVNANSVTFSVGNTGDKTNGQAQITAIEVIYQ